MPKTTMPQQTTPQKTGRATFVACMMLRAALACVTLGISEGVLAQNNAAKKNRKTKEAAREAAKAKEAAKAEEAANAKEAAALKAKHNDNFAEIFLTTILRYLDMPRNWKPNPTADCAEDRTADCAEDRTADFIKLFLHHSGDTSLYHTICDCGCGTAVILLLESQLEKILCEYFRADSITDEHRAQLRTMVDAQHLQPSEYESAVYFGKQIDRVFCYNNYNGGAKLNSVETEANGFRVVDAVGNVVPNSGIYHVAGYPDD
jgi:hypothetical protein